MSKDLLKHTILLVQFHSTHATIIPVDLIDVEKGIETRTVSGLIFGCDSIPVDLIIIF
ncbi:MAG TPA: hypothetical protein VE643_02720 [Nitrososphaeraceae archaeon]|nr:hypothetical protein [Nitrososphaeraceae archaeon]